MRFKIWLEKSVSLGHPFRYIWAVLWLLFPQTHLNGFAPWSEGDEQTGGHSSLPCSLSLLGLGDPFGARAKWNSIFNMAPLFTYEDQTSSAFCQLGGNVLMLLKIASEAIWGVSPFVSLPIDGVVSELNRRAEELSFVLFFFRGLSYLFHITSLWLVWPWVPVKLSDSVCTLGHPLGPPTGDFSFQRLISWTSG